MGSRPSSRSVHYQAHQIDPKALTPHHQPFNGSRGSHRCPHRAHIRATKTCSITSAGANGSSITSRVRCSQPPARPVPHSGHDSTACITRCVGPPSAGRAKPLARRFRGFLPSDSPRLPGLLPRHPSRRAMRYPAFQLIDPPPKLYDHRLLLGDGCLLLGDHRQQGLPICSIVSRPVLHYPLMP